MRAIICILGLLSAGALAVRAGLFDKPDLQVITVTDVPAEGAPLRPPNDKDPVYYVAACVGFRDFAASMAGEKIPKQEDMIRVFSKVLAKQGFLPADEQHPPTQILVYAWGTMYPNRISLYVGDPMMKQQLSVQLNRIQMMGFLGGSHLGLVSKQGGAPLTEIEGLTFHTADAAALSDFSTSDLYVAAVSGYDLQAAQQGKAKMLWSTKISCPSRGFWLADALPAMLTIAGPNIGRETARPVLARAGDRFQPNIKLGDPKLEEFLDSGELPVADSRKLPEKAGGLPPERSKH